jgi:hypothetical protein
MPMTTPSRVHVLPAVVVFAACLLLPAYYVGDRLEPQSSLSLLLTGWMGPLDGHFSWYANPLFAIAVLYAARARRSAMLATGALLLAMSFLLHGRIAVSEAPTYQRIAGYGWGYGLWVAAMAMLAAGQWLASRGASAGRILAATIGAGGVCVAGYAAYYAIGGQSLLAIDRERTQVFQQYCAGAGEKVHRRVDDATGLYLDPDHELRIEPRTSGEAGSRYLAGSGVIGLGPLNTGLIAFYETRDQERGSGYRKYTVGEFQGAHADRLDSEYAVVTAFPDIPAHLNLSAATVTIIDRRDDSVLATSAFVLDNLSGRYCGSERAPFSTTAFITDVLGLTRRFPTIGQ